MVEEEILQTITIDNAKREATQLAETLEAKQSELNLVKAELDLLKVELSSLKRFLLPTFIWKASANFCLLLLLKMIWQPSALMLTNHYIMRLFKCSDGFTNLLFGP
ncbi:hypothetical protein ACH5RR_036807 [Cinchona calisaya]|uniref:Uncharacterized protein n=1 Tax=Cinchona calisaya TaxID=153742 RepID=A0ABD2Y5K4_9GENT